MTEWISVAERLPKKGMWVLTCHSRRRERPMILRIRYLRSADGEGPVWEDEHGDTLGFEVPTYWMPLPELPK
jgi:hypothetical protein